MTLGRLARLFAFGLALSPSMEAGAEPRPASTNLPVVAFGADELAARRIEAIVLGEIELPSGRIVVADPMVQPERPPLARAVPPGRHPVTLYKAQDRIALAAVRFAPGEVARWELAILPGQNPAELKNDEIFGYPVDAGLGCFMDAGAAEAMRKREVLETEQKRTSPRRYSNYYDDIVDREMAPHDGLFVLHRPLPNEGPNVAIFQSGWGDGVYASYWGLDEKGAPLVLVTDFEVLSNADGRDEHQRRHDAVLAGMSATAQEANRRAYAAYRRGDEAAIEAMLAAGEFRPADYLIEPQESMILLAIRQDKPRFLEILVRHGAPSAMTETDGWDGDAVRDYPAYARRLYERTREAELARKRRENGFGPLSDALLDVVTRWEAGRIPRAPAAEGTPR